MARPTNDKKETTIILRVNVETKDRLTREADMEHISLSEYLRKKLGDNSVIQNDISPEMRDTIQMLALYGISFDKFLGMMHESLENGDITIEGGGLKTKDSLDLERLYEACHERGIDPQETIDKTVEMIRRGK